MLLGSRKRKEEREGGRFSKSLLLGGQRLNCITKFLGSGNSLKIEGNAKRVLVSRDECVCRLELVSCDDSAKEDDIAAELTSSRNELQ